MSLGFGVGHLGELSLLFDPEYDRGEGSTVQRKRSHVAPGSLEAPLLPDL